jgi:hypothetical protein
LILLHFQKILTLSVTLRHCYFVIQREHCNYHTNNNSCQLLFLGADTFGSGGATDFETDSVSQQVT